VVAALHERRGDLLLGDRPAVGVQRQQHRRCGRQLQQLGHRLREDGRQGGGPPGGGLARAQAPFRSDQYKRREQQGATATASERAL